MPRYTVKPHPGSAFDQSEPLVAAWPFLEKAGLTTYDYVGGKNGSGALTNTPLWRTGEYGPHLNFTRASTQSVQIANAAHVKALNRNFAVFALVRPTATAADRAVYCRGSNGGFYLRVTSTGAIEVLASQVTSIVTSAGTTTAGAWSLVGASVGNGATATVTVYRDGKADGSNTTTATFSGISGNTCLGIEGVGADAFDGDIAGVWVLDWCPSEAWVRKFAADPFRHFRQPDIQVPAVPSVGVSVQAGYSDGSNTSSVTTTAAISTQPTGSTILVGCVWQDVASVPVVTDNRGNTWKLVKSHLPGVSNAPPGVALFACINANGGAGHTFTSTLALAFSSIFVVEVKNAGRYASIHEVTSTANDTSSPVTSGAITTAYPRNLVVGFTGSKQDANPTYTANNGFTKVVENTNNAQWPGVMAAIEAPSPGSYDSSVGISGATLTAGTAIVVAVSALDLELNNSIVALYKLDEISGNALDAVGGHTLTDGNTVGSATGKIGGARDFEDGNAEHLTSAHHADFNFGSGDFSISLWTKPENPGVDADLVCHQNASAPNTGYAIASNGTPGVIKFTVADASTSRTLSGTTSLVAATWYHVVVTRSGTTLKIYINGALDATDTGAPSGSYDDTVQFTLGAFSGGSSQYYDGLLDQVILYKGRALTPPEVAALYNGGSGIAYPFSYAAPTLSGAALVQATGLANVASGGTVSFSQATTTGNLIVVWVEVFASSGVPTITVADNKGNGTPGLALSQTYVTAKLECHYFWNIVGGASHTITVTVTGTGLGGAQVTIAEYSGVQRTSDPLGPVASVATAFISGALSSGSTTTLPQADMLATSAVSSTSGAVNFSATNNYIKNTEVDGGETLADSYKVVASTAALDGTWSCATSDSYGVGVATFKSNTPAAAPILADLYPNFSLFPIIKLRSAVK